MELEEIAKIFKLGKYSLCSQELQRLAGSYVNDNLNDAFLIENSINVTEYMLRITECDHSNKYEPFMLTYEKILALGDANLAVNIQSELILFNNLLWVCFENISSDFVSVLVIEDILLKTECELLRAFKEVKPFNNETSHRIVNIFINILKNVENYDIDIIIYVLNTLNIILLVLLIQNVQDMKLLNYIKDIYQILVEKESILHGLKQLNNSHYNVFIIGINTNCLKQTVYNTRMIICFYLLQVNEYNEILHCLKTCSQLTNIYYLLGGYSAFMLNQFDLCSGYLSKIQTDISSVKMKGVLYKLFGLVNNKPDESIKYLLQSVECCHLSSYYYLSQEYKKLGLIDLCVEYLDKLIQELKEKKLNHSSDLDNILLNVLNKNETIHSGEVYYILASTYGFGERFEEANEMFDKVISDEILNDIIELKQTNNKRIITTPSVLTIIHETITMKILTGDITSAEQYCRTCITNYHRTELKTNELQQIYPQINITWIHELIDRDMKKCNVFIEQDDNNKLQNVYHECLLHCFDEDIIGLMLLAEILKITQGDTCDEYRGTLTQLLLKVSKFLAASCKENESDKVKLVKCLVSKVCLNIAKCQGSDVEAEKMYKRALSCNNGDKDVLYCYYNYLLTCNKTNNAKKLWTTFYKHDNTLSCEDCQSLSLQYLLRSQINTRQLRDIENNI